MVEQLQATDPRSVGPYRLLGRLGAGRMGQVYLGRSAGGRLVAVKLIRPELAGEPGFRARFAREVAAARTVGGLFTALVVDADAEAAVPWLATAYVPGPSLAEAVDDHGPLPAGAVATLAAGLAAIHAAGVVHRDLKPSNVLLAADGPRVIDFGISRAAEASMLTQSGTVMGSPGFMSPEQAEGGPVGPASDVFSLTSCPAPRGRRWHRAWPPAAAALTAAAAVAALVIVPRAGRGAADTQHPPAAGAARHHPLALGGGSAPRSPAAKKATPSARPGRPAKPPAGTVPGSVSAAPVGSAAGAAPATGSTASGPAPAAKPPAAKPPPPAPATAAVPDVLYTTLSAAASALKARGFGNIPYLYECHGSSAIDDVVRQAPGAGAVIAKTAPVQLYLQADNCHTVPNVIGMNLTNAAYTLKQAGFSNIPYLYQCYGSSNIGGVVSQSPAPGTTDGSTQPVSLRLQANNC